ncbi:potassium channel family protein [Haloferula chungangensis]|uniref:Potassium channel family protein n=1 Tax=Haloferula chungangensis TaxID=1048331 RepID=A0ABW2L1N9_9BACT
MFPGLIASFILVALCVVIHSMGISRILRFTRARLPSPETHPWVSVFFVVQIAWSLILLHMLQIVIWAGYFTLQGCLPDFETSLYFSGVTYSTLGFGDVVLPQRWRLLGAAEGLTGILMCGLSTGLFVATAHRILAARFQFDDESPPTKSV